MPTLFEKFANWLGLQDLFLRSRVHSPGRYPDDVVVSPVRAKIEKISPIQENGLIQEKNLLGRPRFINLWELLNQGEWSDSFVGGTYIKQYLAQWDPHYVISPTGGYVVDQISEAGRALPIFLMRRADLKNERYTLFIQTEHGFRIGLIMIGSWLVKSLTINCKPNRRYFRGERLGHFRLGSSVVLIFPKHAIALLCKEGEKIEYGEPIARFR